VAADSTGPDYFPPARAGRAPASMKELKPRLFCKPVPRVTCRDSWRVCCADPNKQ
jgi:hypothetical protein